MNVRTALVEAVALFAPPNRMTSDKDRVIKASIDSNWTTVMYLNRMSSVSELLATVRMISKEISRLDNSRGYVKVRDKVCNALESSSSSKLIDELRTCRHTTQVRRCLVGLILVHLWATRFNYVLASAHSMNTGTGYRRCNTRHVGGKMMSMDEHRLYERHVIYINSFNNKGD